METAVLLIPILPFLGFLVNGLVGKHLGKRLAALVACALPLGSFACAMAVFAHLARGGAPVEAAPFTWIAAGDLRIAFRLVIDHLSAIMCLVVTGVGSLIHIYSAEYMEHETSGGYARYFSYLNLFTAMMLVLVTGSSLPLLFVGWEGVGLCSYLLIGFWYGDLKNANAGKKAFIVNRVGDFGFLLGMFLLFAVLPERTLEIAELNDLAEKGVVAPAMLSAAAILLFVGACGKSAQIPLYVWLPDAMQGPTPVSALIHAATMVTAGVYMVARMHVLFEHAPYALAVVAAVGMATALLTATMGLAENDIKRVLAYSTISQLGYMFVGVGAAAFGAGIFHLVTHAFFKALLFLGAGAVMHALANNTDLRLMGGLGRKLPVTCVLFTIGALALAGIPPFAGFFSKDEILASAFQKFHAGEGAGWFVIWAAGVLTAGVTAFYTFRAVALAFAGEPRGNPDVYMHAHDPGLRMIIPLVILAAGATFSGFLNVPPLFAHGHEHFSGFLAPVFAGPAEAAKHHGAAVEYVAALIPTLLAIVLALLSYRLYSLGPDAVDSLVFRPVIRTLHRAVAAKYWVDEAYDRIFVQPLKAGAAALSEWIDVAVIDGAVNGFGTMGVFFSEQARRLQRGLVNQYAFFFAAGALLLIAFLVGYL